MRLRGPEDTEENSDPLLPVVPVDLGDELWRVDFSEKPRLHINKNAGGDYKQVGTHPAFVAVVYPAAMREILTHILLVMNHRDFDDPDDPHSRWLRFAVQVLGAGEPPGEDENAEKTTEWVDDAVAAFARKHGLLEKFKSFWAAEVAS